MELIALLLMLPLFMNSSDGAPARELSRTPTVEARDGKWVIHPPEDSSLAMTVVQIKEAQVRGSRGPASLHGTSDRVDVTVSAP